jgi:hypothetical protein
MMFRCIGPFFVLLGMAMASVGDEARAADKRPAMSGLEALPFKERCLLATVLGREMRDLLSWVDPRRLPGVMGDDGFGLLVVPASGEQIRSVFKTGEGCSFALDRTYPNPGKIEVRLAEDPPPLLTPGRSYALLFARELDRGTRWQFDWSLSAVGYAGCPADQKTDHATVDTCRHPGFLHGLPAPDVRITVRKRGARFEAEVANLEFAKWGSNSALSDETTVKPSLQKSTAPAAGDTPR